jgi:hypothetical protein
MALLARTNEEAHLYMDMYPCECGGQDGARDSAVGEHVMRYTCVCRACGRTREFEFRQPDQPVRPEAGGWAVGSRPSELLDAGEWLWVADMFGGAPAEPAGLTPAELAQARDDLAAAGAAVDEVLKFVPPEANEVPVAAFWTERGRELRAAAPSRFLRARLEAVRDTYRSVRDGMA